MVGRLGCLALGLVMVLAPGIALGQVEPTRIGVFDPEMVWRQTEVGKQYNKDLSEARDRLQAGIDKKQEEMEALRSKLRQQQASLNEDRIQQMQKDILNKKTELDRMNEDATKEMKFQLTEVQSRFQDMLLKTLEAFGDEQKYTLILNRGVIDYSSEGIDITQQLIAKFNEMHKVPPAAASNAP